MGESRSRSKRPGEKVLTRFPLDSTFISESLKSGLLTIDDEGNLRAFPFIPLDITVTPILNRIPIIVQDSGSINRASVQAMSGPIAAGNNALNVNASQMVWNPLINFMEVVRTPTVWVTAAPAALGANVVWAAVANERHRILYMTIDFPGTFNAAAVNVLARLMDAAAAVNVNTNCYIPAAATFYNAHFQYDFRPNGLISAAVNTAWNIDLSVAIANNPPRVNIWGTAEP